jgi:cell division septal protein FtsQ
VSATAKRARTAAKRRSRGILISAALTLVLVVLPLGLYLWGSRSPTFSIDRVVLTGCRQVGHQRALRLLEERFVGKNLFTVRAAQVDDALEPLFFVADVDVDRDFPATLRVRVREHVPALYALAGSRWYLVSEKGVVLGAVRRERRKAAEALLAGPLDVARKLPAVRATVPALRKDALAGDEEVRMALEVLATLPADLRAGVAEVRRRPEGIRLRLRSGAVADLGPLSRLTAKAVALQAVLDYYSGQKVAAQYVDVSVPDRPVAKPLL